MANEPDLAGGAQGEWVSYLQQTLNHHYQQSVVQESGTFDEQTESVVRHFRQQNGLGDGGNVDQAVWQALTGGGSGGAAADQGAGAQGSGGSGQVHADPVAGVHDGGADPMDAGAGGAGGSGSSGHDSGAEGAGPTGETGAADGHGDSTDRYLNGEEVAAAQQTFHGTLDTGSIVLSEGGILAVGGYARTVPDHVTFPAGTLTNPPGNFMHWLMHELGHCWQYQHGATVPGLLVSALGADYDYGGQDGLRTAAAAGTPFSDFGYEEQAEIFADYYWAVNGGDTSAFDPYMNSVRNGNWQQPPPVM